MFILKNISKSYSLPTGLKSILNNVNLTIQPNEIITLEGPSGIGKSTLLRIIGLIEKPNAGAIYFNQHPITLTHKKSLDKSKRKVSTIFQDFALLKNLTVLENILLPLKCLQINKNNLSDYLSLLISELGIDNLLDQTIDSLSGGQKQRVAIARALITKPDILLCDEPTSALDKANINQLSRLLKTIQKNHQIAIVIVTHDYEFAKTIADKRYQIKEKNLVQFSNQGEL